MFQENPAEEDAVIVDKILGSRMRKKDADVSLIFPNEIVIIVVVGNFYVIKLQISFRVLNQSFKSLPHNHDFSRPCIIRLLK